MGSRQLAYRLLKGCFGWQAPQYEGYCTSAEEIQQNECAYSSEPVGLGRKHDAILQQGEYV